MTLWLFVPKLGELVEIHPIVLVGCLTCPDTTTCITSQPSRGIHPYY